MLDWQLTYKYYKKSFESKGIIEIFSGVKNYVKSNLVVKSVCSSDTSSCQWLSIKKFSKRRDFALLDLLSALPLFEWKVFVFKGLWNSFKIRLDEAEDISVRAYK